LVGGRDRTKLLDGLDKQRAAVRAGLESFGIPGVPVHTALCFVDGDWPLLAKPFVIREHFISWPKALYPRITVGGPLGEEVRQEVRAALERYLPPASN